MRAPVGVLGSLSSPIAGGTSAASWRSSPRLAPTTSCWSTSNHRRSAGRRQMGGRIGDGQRRAEGAEAAVRAGRAGTRSLAAQAGPAGGEAGRAPDRVAARVRWLGRVSTDKGQRPGARCCAARAAFAAAERRGGANLRPAAASDPALPGAPQSSPHRRAASYATAGCPCRHPASPAARRQGQQASSAMSATFGGRAVCLTAARLDSLMSQPLATDMRTPAKASGASPVSGGPAEAAGRRTPAP